MYSISTAIMPKIESNIVLISPDSFPPACGQVFHTLLKLVWISNQSVDKSVERVENNVEYIFWKVEKVENSVDNRGK